MKTITLFLWCLAGLLIGTVVALAQNPTPIANLSRATTVYPTNIVPVVTNPGQTNGTKGVELDDFLSSLVGFPGWPSVSVTNAIGTVRTNGTTLTAAATSINFVQGSNTVLRATNTSGAVSIEINAVSGSGSVNTNLQVQSLKVFGHQTNTGDIYVNGGSYPKIEITSLTAPTVLTLDTGGITTSAQNNQPYIQLEPQGVLSAQFGTNSWLPSSGFDLGSASARFGIGYFGQIVSTNLRPLVVGGSKIVRTDSSTNLAEVTIGSGLTFDGTTLAASGGGGGGSGTDLHVFTNGVLASIVTNLNFTGLTGSVVSTTLNLGIDGRLLTNLNWAIVASTTNVAGASNTLQALIVANDTSTSNALRNTFIANDTTTSNGVMSQLTLAASNRVQLAGGSGGITVSQSGSGGVQTWTINDDDAGSGSTITYAAIPTSGIVGGSTAGWTTNLSANLLIVPSNLTANVHYLIDVRSAGYVAAISNYQAIYFRDAGLGGVSALGTNGSSTLEIWKDTPSGTTNAILHGPEYSVLAGWGLALVTNNLTRTLTVVQTNSASSIATNATSTTVGFSDSENIQQYNAWFHLTTNLVISPTNLVVGRTVGIYFDTNSLTYDVTVTNTAANNINWNFFVNTNGSTSFTKTNSRRARLYLTCETNGVISAEMGYYR